MEDSTEKFVLIDLDAGKAQPFVKSILNDLELFPELRMLKIIQIMIAGSMIVTVLLFIFGMFRYPSDKDFEELSKKIDSKNVQVSDPKARLEQIINSQNKQQVKTQT